MKKNISFVIFVLFFIFIEKIAASDNVYYKRECILSKIEQRAKELKESYSHSKIEKEIVKNIYSKIEPIPFKIRIYLPSTLRKYTYWKDKNLLKVEYYTFSRLPFKKKELLFRGIYFYDAKYNFLNSVWLNDRDEIQWLIVKKNRVTMLKNEREGVSVYISEYIYFDKNCHEIQKEEWIDFVNKNNGTSFLTVINISKDGISTSTAGNLQEMRGRFQILKETVFHEYTQKDSLPKNIEFKNVLHQLGQYLNMDVQPYEISVIEEKKFRKYIYWRDKGKGIPFKIVYYSFPHLLNLFSKHVIKQEFYDETGDIIFKVWFTKDGKIKEFLKKDPVRILIKDTNYSIEIEKIKFIWYNRLGKVIRSEEHFFIINHKFKVATFLFIEYKSNGEISSINSGDWDYNAL